MRLIPFTTKALTNIATNYHLDSIARLSLPSLVRAQTGFPAATLSIKKPRRSGVPQ